MAQTNDVVITSRSYGSYRLVPVKEDDLLMDSVTLDAKIRKVIEDYENGKAYKMKEGETDDDLLGRMLNED